MKVNSSFKQEMGRVYKEKKCYETLIQSHVPPNTFLKILTHMHSTLEGIKKNLNQFLEKKRLDFARFFFLSNEDLLEIIGQARDPTPVNKHINKLFEGIKEIYCPPQPGSSKAQKIYTITKVRSPDDEEVELANPIQIE
jgi:dynein heavy chain, axonemal